MGAWYYIPGHVPYQAGVQVSANGAFFTSRTMAFGMWLEEMDRQAAGSTGKLVQLYGWDPNAKSWRILRQFRSQSLGLSWGA